jgi:digeranylgeranylglycerophospholipid reductase
MNEQQYDVAVIGGGPAGSRTAALAARSGHRVLLLEKRERIGHPIRCAEAVGPRSDVERYLQLDDSIISSPVNGFLVRSPGGVTMRADMEGIGFIVDRERFDRRLADIAAESGAEVRCGHQAVGLKINAGSVTGLEAMESATGRRYGIKTSIVVGADGVEGHSPRWAGIAGSLRPGELFSCAQELIDGIELPPGPIIEFHMGNSFAPGGYAWVFPKGANRANVGVGLNPLLAEGKTARDYLDVFIADRCPGGARKRFVIGGCSVARGLGTLATDGYLTVGEAAHQNNPFSGGGIINALEGADMAARVIDAALAAGDTSAQRLAAYTRRWNRTVGRTNEAFYLAARVFFDLSDSEMERVMKRVSRVPGLFDEKGVKPVRLTWGILAAYPRLLFRILRLAVRGKKYGTG